MNMTNLEIARNELEKSGAACVAVQEGKIHTSHEKGIKPLMDWLNQDKKLLEGTCVADKVVGKAAALLCVYGGVSSVYAQVISEHAAKALQEHGVPYTFQEKVSYIINRSRTGMCPMEQKVLQVSDPKEAYEVLRQALKPAENK
jgi:hypothetical protein